MAWACVGVDFDTYVFWSQAAVVHFQFIYLLLTYVAVVSSCMCPARKQWGHSRLLFAPQVMLIALFGFPMLLLSRYLD